MILAGPSGAAFAGIIPIGGFPAEFYDEMNPGGPTAVQSQELFSGQATLSNLTPNGAIKKEFSSSLGGDLVVPRSAPKMVGQLGVGRWTFVTPQRRFGGWWENNSGADDATVTFFDGSGGVIGSMVARVPALGQTWVWNGWQSDVPFTRIEVAGNGLINGFIWYEDMSISSVPEPASAGGLLLIAAFGWRGRR
jgi:hypothetical protein